MRPNEDQASNDYEEVVLSVLAFEFSLDDKHETETKIKRKLRRKKLGKSQEIQSAFRSPLIYV